METKVINPLTDKKITIGGKVYKDLIKSGYILVNNNLVMPTISEFQNDDYESENEEFENESESEESGEYEYETEEESEEMPSKYRREYDEEEYDIGNPSLSEYEYKSYGGEKRPAFYERDIEVPSFDLPPVRCIECGKPIATLHKKYIQLRNEGMDPIEIYKYLHLNRPCCRMNITHVPKEYLLSEEKSMVTGVKPKSSLTSVNPNKTLSKNPYFTEKIKTPQSNVIRLYKGGEFEGIKKKVTFGPENEYIEYEKFTTPELLRRQEIGRGKYYISSSK
jgi:DNA-directed RNA polymerase subunit N (RpoN/RPB10)